jgi:hypothetical protein
VRHPNLAVFTSAPCIRVSDKPGVPGAAQEPLGHLGVNERTPHRPPLLTCGTNEPVHSNTRSPPFGAGPPAMQQSPTGSRAVGRSTGGGDGSRVLSPTAAVWLTLLTCCSHRTLVISSAAQTTLQAQGVWRLY